MYLYCSVDRDGIILDFMLSEKWTVATLFFAKALASSGIPLRIVIDKSEANGAGVKENLKCLGCSTKIATVRSNCLNNKVEPDHRFIKRRTRPMLGFKSLDSAAAMLDGIEVAQMIQKAQFGLKGNGFAQFAALAGQLCPLEEVRSTFRKIGNKAGRPSQRVACFEIFVYRHTKISSLSSKEVE